MELAKTHAAQVFQQVTANWPSGEPDEEQRLVAAIDALSKLDPCEAIFQTHYNLGAPECVQDRLEYLRRRLSSVRLRTKRGN